ncbi:MAG: 7-carboxy-7-deazaguanine synthase QueE [Armatimonadetes bacterium]|nr:7-carboxy-7-deazaguanine synthase QueE [Armatimonadota bacterium]
MDKLRISEIFESVQGEGIWAGIPSLFIRVSGCNLRCVWCDTPYASWTPEGDNYDISALLEISGNSSLNHVVLTGGEPMLFDAIEVLVAGLKQQGKTITMETAGTVYREMDVDLMSISPKLTNSDPLGKIDEGWVKRHVETRSNLRPLVKLVSRYNTQLKFVVAEPEQDIPEIEALLAEIGEVDPNRVLLMPEGRDSDQLWKSMRALVPIAMERNWRVCPRLQIDLFGDTRGT